MHLERLPNTGRLTRVDHDSRDIDCRKEGLVGGQGCVKHVTHSIVYVACLAATRLKNDKRHHRVRSLRKGIVCGRCVQIGTKIRGLDTRVIKEGVRKQRCFQCTIIHYTLR